jgi:hypothetical protein
LLSNRKNLDVSAQHHAKRKVSERADLKARAGVPVRA